MQKQCLLIEFITLDEWVGLATMLLAYAHAILASPLPPYSFGASPVKGWRTMWSVN